jgi:hypothetical protein
MSLFRRKRDEGKTARNPLEDIPIGSMVDLTDTTTFALSEAVSQTFEVKAVRRYEDRGFLRWLYLLENDEEAILGVEKVGEDDYNLARFVLDSEEEFDEPLPSRIIMNFEEREIGQSEKVEYERQGVIEARMIYMDPDVTEEYEVELHDYAAEDGTILMVEICEDWVTYFLGEPINPTDVTVYPKEGGSDL